MTPGPKLSFEEFLALEAPARAEWIDGRVVELPSVHREHSRITGFLAFLIRSFASLHARGEVFEDPFVMRLLGSQTGRAPDIMFVGEAHLDRVRENYLDGPCDVAVEVVSPGSRSTDRADKFYEYEAAGIPEYWLIDPDRRTAEFFVLNAEGRYEATPLADGAFHSTVLTGFWLRVAWLWDRPPLHAVASELGLR